MVRKQLIIGPLSTEQAAAINDVLSDAEAENILDFAFTVRDVTLPPQPPRPGDPTTEEDRQWT